MNIFIRFPGEISCYLKEIGRFARGDQPVFRSTMLKDLLISSFLFNQCAFSSLFLPLQIAITYHSTYFVLFCRSFLLYLLSKHLLLYILCMISQAFSLPTTFFLLYFTYYSSNFPSFRRSPAFQQFLSCFISPTIRQTLPRFVGIPYPSKSFLLIISPFCILYIFLILHFS